MKIPTKKGKVLLLGLTLFSFACKTPPVPSEVDRTEVLEQALWRAGASLYAQEEYALFRTRLTSAKRKLGQEKAKFGWFRNYESIRSEYRDLVDQGAALLAEIENQKASASKSVAGEALSLKTRVDRLKSMTGYFNENSAVRKNLIQADIKLAEVDILLRKEQFETVQTTLANCRLFIEKAEEATAAVLSRYLEEDQLDKWKKWTDETIGESRKKGIVVVIVNKLERKLTVYRKGEALASYDIGLGRYGLSDKLYAGDDATPEGKYQIIRKYPTSIYSKALLINYPNEEDKKAFAAAKKSGLVPGQADIGGAIEIHGGGKDSLTKGCVGLEDRDMDEVYRLTETGTPVTIVGALSVEDSILAEIKKFRKDE